MIIFQETKIKDNELDVRLHEWEIETPIPDSFRRDVWLRINNAENQSNAGVWTAFVQRILVSIQRPAFAAATCTLMVLAGLSVGVFVGNTTDLQRLEGLRSEYVAAINPLFPGRIAGLR